MPSYIIKLNKEEDLYVYWSEIVDAPHIWGTRDVVSQYMIRIGENNIHELNQRFDRADEHGTSAFAYRENYGWDDNGILIYHQQGYLRRNELKRFLESASVRDHEFDLSLLHPFEDD